MNPDSYKTLIAYGRDEFIVNKSRFIGSASPVKTEEEAIAFIKQIREEFKDASHNCYAYIIGKNMGIMRYSDDNEPQGTAGMPILEVMRAKKIVDCVCVVTRYFGGVLLGAGGLVRAYTQGCKIGIEAAGVGDMHLTGRYLLDVEYPMYDKLSHKLQSLPVIIEDKIFAGSITLQILIKSTDAEYVLKELTALSDGKLEPLLTEEIYYPWREDI